MVKWANHSFTIFHPITISPRPGDMLNVQYKKKNKTFLLEQKLIGALP